MGKYSLVRIRKELELKRRLYIENKKEITN